MLQIPIKDSVRTMITMMITDHGYYDQSGGRVGRPRALSHIVQRRQRGETHQMQRCWFSKKISDDDFLSNLKWKWRKTFLVASGWSLPHPWHYRGPEWVAVGRQVYNFGSGLADIRFFKWVGRHSFFKWVGRQSFFLSGLADIRF